MPILLGRKRTPQEFANFVFDMAQLNPRGFRPFGGIVEQAAIAAGMMEPSFGPQRRMCPRRKRITSNHFNIPGRAKNFQKTG